MIYVTGASGHIGNNLVKKLFELKYEFRILARRQAKSVSDFADKTILGDIFDHDFLEGVLQEGDVIVHLAAYINLKNDKQEMTNEINYLGVKTIADICVAKKVYLIYTSSTDCLTEKEYLLTKTKKSKVDNLKSYYQQTKAKATNYLIDLRNENKLKTAIIYPSAVIGTNDYKPSALGKEMQRALKRRVCFYFHGGYNFVDVKDVVNSIIACIEIKANDSYLVTGEMMSLYQMYSLIFAQTNHKVLMIKVPLYLIKFIALLIPKFKVMIEALLTQHNFSNQKMITDLKISPTPIANTIKETAKWFKENKDA
jgi:dihydroflavonol-4-reductase